MPAKWTPSDPAYLVSAYQSGVSCKELARQCGVGRATMRKTLAGLGAVIRNDRVYVLDEAVIVAAYRSGISEQQLAADRGIARGPIRRVLVANGIEPRGCGEAHQIVMGNMLADERTDRVAAAHRARRGQVDTLECRVMRAAARQGNVALASEYEVAMMGWLADRGIDTIPQQAIGPYSADIGASPVAVEIFGGGWHAYGRHAARAADRFRYIFNEGWNVVIVWVSKTQYPLRVEAADYVAAFIQEARSDPSMRGQYRVIWGDGKAAPADRLNIDNLTRIPARRAA